MDLELRNWLYGAKYRTVVLKLLKIEPSLPSTLAKKLNIHRSSITRILKDLMAESLIAKTHRNTKTTLYFLTEKGMKVVEELETLEKGENREM